MIISENINIREAIRYSWKILVISYVSSLLAFVMHREFPALKLDIPESIVPLMGTALSIILAFRNVSAYERWWEARKIWGAVLNESRTFARQVMTILDRDHVSPSLWKDSVDIIRRQIGWTNALKYQLRNISDEEKWNKNVYQYLSEKEVTFLGNKYNKASHIMMLQGAAIKTINASETMDIYSYIQMDDTLTRLTDLQGGSERIKSTPLPKPYDYYTYFFLLTFVIILPFGFADHPSFNYLDLYLFPGTIVISWIFNQIFIIGSALSRPFGNLATDIALDAITTLIEIDLKEYMDADEIPGPIEPLNGVIT